MRRRRVDWGPRRVLDAATCQVMVGDDALAAAPADPRGTSISDRPPALLSRLHARDSA
jgi:hypothetical protein